MATSAFAPIHRSPLNEGRCVALLCGTLDPSSPLHSLRGDVSMLRMILDTVLHAPCFTPCGRCWSGCFYFTLVVSRALLRVAAVRPPALCCVVLYCHLLFAVWCCTAPCSLLCGTVLPPALCCVVLSADVLMCCAALSVAALLPAADGLRVEGASLVAGRGSGSWSSLRCQAGVPRQSNDRAAGEATLDWCLSAWLDICSLTALLDAPLSMAGLHCVTVTAHAYL